MTRPRFRFSLMTMLVGVTILGCWIGYQCNWIRKRHDYLAERGYFPLSSNEGPAPWSLLPFGESGVRNVGAGDDQEYWMLRGLFPEASISIE
jgi:hypothetical protein